MNKNLRRSLVAAVVTGFMASAPAMADHHEGGDAGADKPSKKAAMKKKMAKKKGKGKMDGCDSGNGCHNKGKAEEKPADAAAPAPEAGK